MATSDVERKRERKIFYNFPKLDTKKMAAGFGRLILFLCVIFFRFLLKYYIFLYPILANEDISYQTHPYPTFTYSAALTVEGCCVSSIDIIVYPILNIPNVPNVLH